MTLEQWQLNTARELGRRAYGHEIDNPFTLAELRAAWELGWNEKSILAAAAGDPAAVAENRRIVKQLEREERDQ